MNREKVCSIHSNNSSKQEYDIWGKIYHKVRQLFCIKSLQSYIVELKTKITIKMSKEWVSKGQTGLKRSFAPKKAVSRIIACLKI